MKGVPGVAGIDTIGGHVKQYHVLPDPARLVAYGLTFSDLIEALERANQSLGAGQLERNGELFIVRADGRIGTTAEIADVVVATRDRSAEHTSELQSLMRISYAVFCW